MRPWGHRMFIQKVAPHLVLFLLTFLPIFLTTNFALSADEDPSAEKKAEEKKSSKGKSEEMRNFYDVLEDVFSDFEYDLKNGKVNGIVDVAIRSTATSENVPPSFKGHLDLLVTEKATTHAKGRFIQCMPCRNQNATLSGSQVVISSSFRNTAELARLARQYQIKYFMDIAFSYQPAGLILSLATTEVETGSIVWSKTYNSETSRAAMVKRGVDYTQIEEARSTTTFVPQIQYRLIVYYLYEPNILGYTGTLAFGFRMVERYDNRTKEVGFEMDYLMDTTTVAGGTTAEGTNLYSGFNLTMLFIHAWNLHGQIENYNQIRGSVFGAVGGTYASGFLGGVFRGGYEWRLGKHWSIGLNAGYRPTGTAFLPGNTQKAISGFEGGIGISAMF